MYSSFISLKSVIDRVMRNPLMADCTYESLLVWSVDVIRLIGSPAFMQHKIIRLKIEDYRAVKPEDIVFVTQARRVVTPYDTTKQSTWDFQAAEISSIPTDGYNMTYNGSDIWKYDSDNIAFNVPINGEEYQQLFEATDPFHDFYNKSYMSGLAPLNTYKFNGNYVYTSFPEGTIDIAYDGILLDDEGVPMIPNDMSVEKAIENYIKSQYYGILSDLGKDVVRAYERAEKEYCWYIGQAQSHSALMSLDRRESLSNTMNRLILNDKPHGSFYRHIGHPEMIKKQ